MRKRNVFAIAIASLALALGVGAGLKTNNVQKAQAETTYKGSFGIEFQEIGTGNNWAYYWDTDDAYVAAYIWKGSSNGWSEMLETTEGTHRYIFEYELNFDPVGSTITLVRYNPVHGATPSWDDTNTWAKVENIPFGQLLYVYNNSGNSSVNSINYYIGATSDSWSGSWNYTLHDAKLNSGNFQVFGNISLSATDEFKLVHKTNNGAATYVNGYEAHSSISSYFSVTDNISCSKAGNYAIYYPADGKIYITDHAHADADEWAQYFLNNVGCDANGVNKPTGWDDCATEYGKLSGDAKNLIYPASANENGSFIEKAMARYDWAVSHNSNIKEADRFVKNSSGTVRAASNVVSPLSPIVENNATNVALIIVIVSTISLVALGGFFFIKRKKEN